MSQPVRLIVLCVSVSQGLFEDRLSTTGGFDPGPVPGPALHPFTGSVALSLTTSANSPLPVWPGDVVTIVSMPGVTLFASPLISSAMASAAQESATSARTASSDGRCRTGLELHMGIQPGTASLFRHRTNGQVPACS